MIYNIKKNTLIFNYYIYISVIIMYIYIFIKIMIKKLRLNEKKFI